jgi:hypothetical protein
VVIDDLEDLLEGLSVANDREGVHELSLPHGLLPSKSTT